MADNVKIIDGGGATSFIRAIGLAGGTYVMYSIPSKVDGTAFSAPATIALSMPVALPTDQIVSAAIQNASLTALISNASVTALISNASITANITQSIALTSVVSGTVTINNASLTALLTNASLTANIINASLTTLISNASVTTLISNASLTTLITNASLTATIANANANGAATSAGSAPVVVANDQAALATIISTKNLANGNSTTLLTPAFSTVSMSTLGTASIVAGNATTKIRVIALQLTNTTATAFKWQSAATDITGAANFTTNSGYVLPFNPVGWFETATGSALVGNSTASSAIGGSITYVLI